jgi:aldehyde dehydrogenase (NAD+)
MHDRVEIFGVTGGKDTPYGLASAVWAGDKNNATAIARRIRAGQCAINGGDANHEAPFGGYKESGPFF